jgi:hypothetical protein
MTLMILERVMLACQVIMGLAAAISLAMLQGMGGLRHLLLALFFGMAAVASYQLAAWWPLVVGAMGMLMFMRLAMNGDAPLPGVD